MEKSKTIDRQELIEQVQTEGMTAIEEVYQVYRVDFMAFVAR